MKRLTMALLAFLFTFSANANLDDLLGSYSGTIDLNFGKGTTVIHIQKIPVIIESKLESKYLVSFRWFLGCQGASQTIYFDSVDYSSASGELLATAQFNPIREYGVIYNSLYIKNINSGEISGEYFANTMTSRNQLMGGKFKAKLLSSEADWPCGDK